MTVASPPDGRTPVSAEAAADRRVDQTDGRTSHGSIRSRPVGRSRTATLVLAGAAYGQNGDTIEVESCRHAGPQRKYGAECGTIYVPENRSRSGSRRIDLAFERIRAEAAAPGAPLDVLNGGPGSVSRVRRCSCSCSRHSWSGPSALSVGARACRVI